MSNEKKTVVSEEVKEKARELSMEELEKVTGGVFSGIYGPAGERPGDWELPIRF